MKNRLLFCFRVRPHLHPPECFSKGFFFSPPICLSCQWEQEKHLHLHNTHTDSHTSRWWRWRERHVKNILSLQSEFVFFWWCPFAEIKTENKKWFLCVTGVTERVKSKQHVRTRIKQCHHPCLAKSLFYTSNVDSQQFYLWSSFGGPMEKSHFKNIRLLKVSVHV